MNNILKREPGTVIIPSWVMTVPPGSDEAVMLEVKQGLIKAKLEHQRQERRDGKTKGKEEK